MLVVAVASVVVNSVPASQRKSVHPSGSSQSTRGGGTIRSLGNTRLSSFQGPAANDWVNVPLPANLQTLESISCPTDLVCVAVGFTTNNRGVIVETLDGGATWTEPFTPSTSYENFSIDCSSATICAMSNVPMEYFDPLAGGTPHNATGTYAGQQADEISCNAAGDCTAIINGTADVITSTDGGQSWTGENGLPFTGVSTHAGGIHCNAAEQCIVGYTNSTGFSENSGLGWGTDLFASGFNQAFGTYNSSIGAISCASGSSFECLTVGGTLAFIASNYTDQDCNESPSPCYLDAAQPTFASFNGDACVPDGNCVAIGYSKTGSYPPIIYETNVYEDSPIYGLPWVAQTFPTTDDRMSGVTCTPDGSGCFVVGESSATRTAFLLTDMHGAMLGPPGGVVPQIGGSGAPALTGSTIDIATGDFFHTTTDASVATYGPALSFTRTYDADMAATEAGEQSPSPGPMGFGWTDNWGEKLELNTPSSGDVTFVGPTGASLEFDPPVAGACPQPYQGDPSPSFASGSYCAISYANASLTYSSSSGTYTLVTHKPDQTFVFNSSGQLTNVYDSDQATIAMPELSVSHDTPSPGSGDCPSSC
jgi:hypothetical protein